MSLSPDTNVLVLAADLFEDSELLYPVLRLREEGATVTVASPDGGPSTGKKGHGPLAADLATDEVQADDYAALVIPGGFAPDRLRRDEPTLALVRRYVQEGKPVAFICHAGWVPISAGVIEGRRATSVGVIRVDMENAGCRFEDAEVVVDGPLISSRTPADLGPWMRTLIEALGGRVS